MSVLTIATIKFCLSLSSIVMIGLGLWELGFPRSKNSLVQNSRWVIAIGGTFSGASYLLGVPGVAAIFLLVAVIGYLMAKYAIWKQVCSEK